MKTTKPIAVYAIHGLLLKGGIDTHVMSAVKKLPFVEAPYEEAVSWTQWREVRDDIVWAKSKGFYSGYAIIGHSMGAGAASYVTDYTKVDRVFLLDPAGQAMSPFGNNTGKALDFWDRSFALVFKYRPRLVSGQPASKLVQYQSYLGHMGTTYDPTTIQIIKANLQALAQDVGAA